MKTERSNNPAILFDLDGTHEHVIAWAASLRSSGIVPPNWKIHRRIGMNGQSMVRQLLREPEINKRRLKWCDLRKNMRRHSRKRPATSGCFLERESCCAI
jgi:hypothetical protein